MTTGTASDPLPVECFDGVPARPRAAALTVADQALCIDLPGEPLRRVPLRDVRWPERQRHGARVVHLRDGTALHCADAGRFDAWFRRQPLNESWVVKAQQSWRATVVATLVLLAVCGAVYQWGLPWVARASLALVPLQVDRELGDVALQSIRGEDWLAPSELPAAQQQRLRAAWAAVDARAGAHRTPIQLHFHKSRLGPNAFALPGGHVVLTDEIVQLLDGHDDVLVGVVAHEAGHVHHRHGMRMLAQATLLGTLTSVAFGDFSGLLATAPALLGQLGYSRDLEREADGHAIAVLQANGVSPAVMVTLFERLQARQRHERQPRLPIALGSHPADAERIARFRAAAGGR